VFLQSVKGSSIGPLMYLGAKHMVTATITWPSWWA